MLDEETEQDKTVSMHSDSPNGPQSTTEGSQNSKHHGGEPKSFSISPTSSIVSQPFTSSQSKTTQFDFNMQSSPPKYPGESPASPPPNAQIFRPGNVYQRLLCLAFKSQQICKFYIVCFLPHDHIYGQINCESSDAKFTIDQDSFENEAANIVDAPAPFEHQFPQDGSPYLSWHSFCRRVETMEKRVS
jgi:hypothetical protein